MNDKTAIEKAKETIIIALGVIDKLVDIAQESKAYTGQFWDDIDKITKALAELDAEKPWEDAREVARIVHEECFVDISQTTSTPSRSLIWDIDTAAHVVKSFAASYHAAYCKACKALPDVNE